MSQNIEGIKAFSKRYSDYDTNYVCRYQNRFLISPSFFLRTNYFSFKDLAGEGNSVVYKPNTPMKVGIVGSYKWLRMGFAFKIPSYLNEKGNTQTFSMYLNTQTRILNWGIDFYWIQNKGYYLANPEVNIPDWSKGDVYPFRSDISTKNIGFSTHMVFSDKFSLKAAMHQTDKQIKNAGGIAVQVGLSYSSLESMDGTSLIPDSQKEYYPTVSTLTKGSFYSLNIRPGYAYTFVIGDLFATAIAHIGVGFQIQSYILTGNDDWELLLSPTFKFNPIIGYNKGNAFVKLSYTYESSNFHMKQTLFRNSFTMLSLGGGIRID